ncbi:diaminobutyrate acetyltransferase [Mesobacillus persicus]|uniref:L-2,4-diaminobutyric acid acetyltransferase n=1 Tax=Mesobacillus persicus TaxID=930146 RepID=A0A1H8GIJ6_9BACI|nr:diaminobutyrate acetyltransferase [Mesobacillus persicus]SEN43783.1 diaminobutyrate acetyltransferase [Mesobacillus persicus]
MIKTSELDKLTSYSYRIPDKEDGAKMWELIKSTSNMDLNSAYSYLLLSHYFSDTCVIAEDEDQIIGFVSAFRPPANPDTVFVWQVAVNSDYRGKGIGNKLLNELLDREACEDVQYLEATVSPSNVPSQSLFKGLAKKMDCPCEISDCFTEEMFPEPGHEAEQTYRVGPFNQK